MRISLLTIALTFMLVSCEKDPAEPAVEVAPVAKLSMKVNGTQWTSEKNTSAIVATVSSDGQTDQVTLTAATNGNEFFQLATAKEINGSGTYNVPSNQVGVVQFWNSTKTYVRDTTKAPITINITGIRTIAGKKYVKGTFSGWLMKNTDTSDKIEITEGQFNGIDP